MFVTKVHSMLVKKKKNILLLNLTLYWRSRFRRNQRAIKEAKSLLQQRKIILALKLMKRLERAQMKMLEGWRQRNYFKVSLQEDGENKCGQVQGNANLSKLIIQRRTTFLGKTDPMQICSSKYHSSEFIQKIGSGASPIQESEENLRVC